MKTRFICPKCRQPLCKENKSLKCEANHTYDISAEGYVNLTSGKQGSGDSKEMCRARRDFLSKGYYLPLANAVSALIAKLESESVVDMGCGEGYYDRAICTLPKTELCGIDLAKDAVRLAAKAAAGSGISNAEYGVASIFDMPFSDESFDSALSVFAPVPNAEAARVLKKGGCMIVVTPGERHLDGLKSAVYERPYSNVEKQKDYPEFAREKAVRVAGRITVEKADIGSLFLMTPYYWKTSEADAAKLKELEILETSFDFIITPYLKR